MVKITVGWGGQFESSVNKFWIKIIILELKLVLFQLVFEVSKTKNYTKRRGAHTYHPKNDVIWTLST